MRKIFSIFTLVFFITSFSFTQITNVQNTQQLNVTPAFPIPSVTGVNFYVPIGDVRTLYYWIVVNDTVHISKQMFGPFIVTNAPQAVNISGTNFVQVTWNSLGNGYTYDVLRTTTPTAPSGTGNYALTTGITASTFNNTSETLSSYTMSSFGSNFSFTSQSANGIPTLTATYNGNTIFSLNNNGTMPDGTVNAFLFSGADMCASILAAIATGATSVNARNFVGAQPCTSNPFANVSNPLTLWLGNSTISTTVQWNTGSNNNVLTNGNGRNATVIQPGTGFPNSTPVLNIGDGSHLIYATRFANLQSRCNGTITPTGCVALYATGINEQSGGNNLLLIHNSHGLQIDGSTVMTQHFNFYDLEVMTITGTASTDQVLVNATGPGGEIHHATVVTADSTVQNSCFHITGSGSNGYVALTGEIHCEHANDAAFYDTGTSGKIGTLDLNTGTTVLHTNTNSEVTADNLRQVSSVTNTYKNDVLSISMTDPQCSYYVQSRSFAGQQVGCKTGYASHFGDVIGAGNNTRFALESSSVNGNASYQMFDSVGNGFGMQGNPNSGNPLIFFRPISAYTLGTTSFTLATSTGVSTFAGPLAIGGGSTINKVLNNSATLTYTAISAATCQEQTMTITNASTTNKGASCSPGATLGNANVSWSSWVSAASTVSVRVCNPTAGSITPSAVSWGCTVMQ